MQHFEKKLGIPLSVLDLIMVNVDGSPSQSMQNSLDLARHSERWGYKRYWLAEHHNIKGIARTATAVLIGFIAGGTSTIRVGSGGVMLPNHAPLIIAEQFGTLESLYPGRIDLGLALMQIGSVNVVLTSTAKQFSGVSLGMNLLIYLIGASVGPVIAGTFMQANQVFVESETNNISASFPSPESYGLTFLTAALFAVISIVFAMFLISRY